MKWTFQSHQRLITSSTAQRRGTQMMDLLLGWSWVILLFCGLGIEHSHEKLRVVPGCGHSMLSAVGTSNHCRISLLTGPPSQRPSDSESSTEPRSVHWKGEAQARRWIGTHKVDRSSIFVHEGSTLAHVCNACSHFFNLVFSVSGSCRCRFRLRKKEVCCASNADCQRRLQADQAIGLRKPPWKWVVLATSVLTRG